jgi:tetratricopeptide (TPR) repeat protein
MSREEKVLLNLVFFDNRFRELELKQWWLAEEIGVDRKTVGRWLTGQTKRIRKDNLKKLSEILDCVEKDLILRDEASQFASVNEQKAAAKLIEQENLMEILTPSGKWPLLEGLIKASLEPNLPLSLLGQLYNFLCVAAWRQSDLDRADSYLKKAQEILAKTNHKSVLARTRLNEATLASFRGKFKKSLEGYLYCIENQKYLDEQGVYASALSNIGCVYQEYGDLEKSIHYQELAIKEFEDMEKPINLSIAYIGLCDTLIEMDELDKAWSACEKSMKYATESHMKRGLGDCDVFFSFIHSKRGNYDKAMDSFEDAEDKFKVLGITEGRTCRAGAMALAGLGKKEEALELLELGFGYSADFPYEHYQLNKLKHELTGDESVKKEMIRILTEGEAELRLKSFLSS